MLLKSSAAHSQPVQQRMILVSTWSEHGCAKLDLLGAGMGSPCQHGVRHPTTLIAAAGAALRDIAFQTPSCTEEAG